MSSNNRDNRRCKNCHTHLRGESLQCPNPKCRHWNIDTSVSNTLTKDGDNGVTVVLSKAKAKSPNRIITNLVDEVFGGGIVETSVNLLAGDPGAGKTTLCLQLADIYCEMFPLKEALYIANEQSAEEIALTSERLELKHPDRIRIVKAMGGVNFDIGDLILFYEPSIVFLDSVTKWSGEDMSEAVIICERLKDYCVRIKAPAIVVNQVTKDGDHAGLNKLQHAVDMTAMFDVIIDDNEDLRTAPRRLMNAKNRFGPAPVEQYYLMTPRGLMLIDPDDEQDSDTDEEDE